jgi:1-deoxy-D-xylulose 5-phosphate reductoisomerase
VKRVALLGATGSIGRQAVEIVEAHPELELCAAASGSTPLDDVDAPLKEVGGDLTELLERAQPDVVLNAVVGFAGVHATLWALEHGIDLALANKESLIAAGTVDSATLANKGLEVIEAHYLFDLPYDRIEVAIQPTSIVHALVRFRDGASLAHLGYPDMRVPISYALTYPERAATPLPPLDLTSLTLEFSPPDTETFPMLSLARAAGGDGGCAPCVYNAANEVAVAAFLAGRLPFLGIPEVVGDTLAAAGTDPVRDVDDLVDADRAARELAEGALATA